MSSFVALLFIDSSDFLTPVDVRWPRTSCAIRTMKADARNDSAPIIKAMWYANLSGNEKTVNPVDVLIAKATV